MCQGQGGHPGIPVPNSPNGLCGHKVTFEEEEGLVSVSSRKLSTPCPAVSLPVWTASGIEGFNQNFAGRERGKT